MTERHAPAEDVVYPVPEEMDDPRFRWMFNYWRSRSRGQTLPGRSDLDPVEFPRLLGQVNLIDVIPHEAGYRFRYRLWGSQVTEIIGSDFTGRFLDEIDQGEQSHEPIEVLEQTVASRRPHFWRQDLPGDARRYRSYRRLLLPLADDGEVVDMLFALLIGDVNAPREFGTEVRLPSQAKKRSDGKVVGVGSARPKRD